MTLHRWNRQQSPQWMLFLTSRPDSASVETIAELRSHSLGVAPGREEEHGTGEMNKLSAPRLLSDLEFIDQPVHEADPSFRACDYTPKIDASQGAAEPQHPVLIPGSRRASVLIRSEGKEGQKQEGTVQPKPPRGHENRLASSTLRQLRFECNLRKLSAQGSRQQLIQRILPATSWVTPDLRFASSPPLPTPSLPSLHPAIPSPLPRPTCMQQATPPSADLATGAEVTDYWEHAVGSPYTLPVMPGRGAFCARELRPGACRFGQRIGAHSIAR